jgi:esterase/lipase superfamily enzyme
MFPLIRSSRRITLFASPVVCFLLLAGCGSRELMPTPNLYANNEEALFVDLPPEFQTTTIDLLYVTDRAPIDTDDGTLEYGSGRSSSVAFGSCLVEIGEDLTWDQLVAESLTRDRSADLPLAVKHIEEHGRFFELPMRLARVDGEVVIDPKVVEEAEVLVKEFHREIDERLAKTPRKEAYVFIHGYRNNFDDAAFAMAELWHFMGREGVPIIYTWPAGAGGGLLRGYEEDYESSDFTVYHLKQFLRTLAANKNLEKIHIIAHSRGTGVASAAVREIVVESLAAGEDAKQTLKLENLVLAAPDLDFKVASVRIGAERVHRGVDHMTVYVSRNDKAIGLSEWLFGGNARLGTLRAEDLSPTQIENFELLGTPNLIDARVRPSGTGHSYFRSDPAVSSDLILLLRYGREPGAENGRPLEPIAPGYWAIDDGYPQAPASK